jgi:hypothetical protein
VATGQVAACYTLSASSIPLVDLPPEETKRLSRYPTLPAVRIGRLVVDERFQGRGLGAAMLMNAAHRTLRADAAAYTLLVDAKNDWAVAFNRHHGFRPLASQPRKCFYPSRSRKRLCWRRRLAAAKSARARVAIHLCLMQPVVCWGRLRSYSPNGEEVDDLYGRCETIVDRLRVKGISL